MQWRGQRESDNVEDRRSDGGISGASFGGGGGKFVGGGIGAIIIGVIYALISGQNPLDLLLQNGSDPTPQQTIQRPASPQADDESAAFVKVVLADNEDVWDAEFQHMNQVYRKPVLVLFRGSTRSGCGSASASSGPFYCPEDEKVYIDLSFYDELRTRFKVSGDFAMAYVISHEVGHHLQKLFGVMAQVQQKRSRMSETEYNKLSVRLELQADFYAGVWANHAQKMKNILEAGDIEEALNAANAIGDDRLQKEAQGYVVPDGFTHGTSAQRMYWFKKGYETGDIRQGDTFSERM